MDISYINSGTKIYRICNNNCTNPQVSFCGSQIMDQINEFKTSKKTNGFHNVKTTDLVRILKYFGYSDTEQTSHRHVVNCYGQKYQYKDETIANPNFAAAVIRGIKMADDFDGALFLFAQEPTPEQIRQCKQIVLEKPPYLDPKNKYAQLLKKEKDALVVEKASEAEETKKNNEKINQQRIMQLELTQSVDSQERKLNDLKDDFKELKEILSKKDNKILNVKIEKIKKCEPKIEELIAQIRKLINNSASKLQNNKLLNNEEVDNLRKLESQIKASVFEFEQEIEHLQEPAVAVIEEVNLLVEKINLAYDSLIMDYVDLKAKVDSHGDILENVTFLFPSQKTIVECKNAVSKIKKELEKIEYSINNIQSLSDDVPLKKLEKQLSLIENIKNSIINISERYEPTAKLIEKDYLPFNQTSDLELNKRREERIQKFNMKMEHFKQQSSVQDSNFVQNEQVTGKTSTPSQNNKVNVESELSSKDKKLARMLAQKISPFPIDYVQNRLAKIFESQVGIILNQFVFSDTSYSADTMIDTICLDLSKNYFTKETVNAIRFAFLQNLYEQSVNPDNRIFSLNGKQSREIFDKIQKGNKEFEIKINNEILHIKLDREFDMQKLEKTYKKYLKNVCEDLANSKAVLDYLLKFAPNDTRIQFYAQEHFADKGAYYTKLIDESSPYELKLALVKDFWEYMDTVLNDNYSKEIIENFEKDFEQQALNAQHQEKIQLFETIDWQF